MNAVSQPKRVKVAGSITNPSNTRVSFPVADTEQSYTFPANTKQFCILNPRGGTIKAAWVAGDIALVNSFTILPGGSYPEYGIDKASLTIYWQSNKIMTGDNALEIIIWT